MKHFLIAAVLLSVGCCAHAGDLPSVTLGKVLAALEHAHNTHSTAMKLCGFKTEHEIGWDYMERDTRELANAQPTPGVSRMVEVLSALRTERRSLLSDFGHCAFKLNQTETLSIIDAMNSLDEAASDVEDSVRDRTWNLEEAVEYYKDHPCPK